MRAVQARGSGARRVAMQGVAGAPAPACPSPERCPHLRLRAAPCFPHPYPSLVTGGSHGSEALVVMRCGRRRRRAAGGDGDDGASVSAASYGLRMATADDVRRLALSLPGATEKLAWGMPTFRVGIGGKIFASLGDDDQVIGVKCPKEDRDELIAAEPEKFFIRAGHDDNYAWLRVRLAELEDEEELYAILLDSWRQAAPRRLQDQHPDVARPPAG